GFITFSIETQPGLPGGTLIENTASIYFDYNTPVQTNTTTSQIYWEFVNSISENISVSAFPNPFADATSISVDGVKGNFDFTVNNVLGMKMAEQKNISEK